MMALGGFSAQGLAADIALPAADIVVSQDEARPIEERGGDFTLFGASGSVSLSDYRGKVVAIYFGYSQCPDVCPTNLSLLGSAMNQLSDTELAEFQAIFVSVDPGRDNPQTLAEYTRYFHPDMIGISGAPADLDPVVAQYGAYYEKITYSNSELKYGIAHTSETYIVNRQGKLVRILAHATPPDEIVAAIRETLDETQVEAPVETQVETPVETQVETPVETPVETQVETPQ